MIASCAIVAAGVTFIAPTAAAAPAAEAAVTAAVTLLRADTLDVSVPETAELGSGVPGATINGVLGLVTVDDSREFGEATWQATVSTSGFQTDGGVQQYQRVDAPDVSYWSGVLVATSGDGMFEGLQVEPSDAEPLTEALFVVGFTGSGNNTAGWEPTLVVTVPLDKVAGTYTATVTHSVA